MAVTMSVLKSRTIRSILAVLYKSECNIRKLVTLSAQPQECLVDELIDMKVAGLSPGQKVTMQVSLMDNEQKFGSVAHFKADNQGNVNLTEDESLGGNYTGVMPMGLFSSILSSPGQRRGIRLFKRDATTPFSMQLSVHNDHLPFEDICHLDNSDPGLCSVNLRRWYMGKGVTRQEIEEENGVCGTLYLPPGEGPFPGVIDMFGSIGGILEFRAALLASRGFASLALPYFNYRSLPKLIEDLKFDYFYDSSEWLAHHPKVIPGGIGAIGVSKGAEIASLMGMYCPSVKAVVNINGPAYLTMCDMMFGDMLIPGFRGELSDCLTTPNGISMKAMLRAPADILFDYNKLKAKMLLILSLDDQCVDPNENLKLVNVLPEEQRKLIEVVKYPGAGHLVEPPYAPLCTNSFHQTLMDFIVWGGNVRQHAEAQKDAWPRMRNFMLDNLPKHI